MLPLPAKAARFIECLVRSPGARYLAKKPLMWFTVLFYVCSAAFIIAVTPTRIAQFVHNIVQRFRYLPYGYMILIVVMIVASFPPFIGYGPLLNLFGSIYGMRGFFPAAIGTLAASIIVFVTLRMMFAKRLCLPPTNVKWLALEAVIRSRGTPLIILIRMSSLVPWAWSNSLLASISSVSLLQFFIATLFLLPDVFVRVLVGSYLARLFDHKQRSRTYAQIEVLDDFLMISGILSTLLASSLVYHFIQKEIKRLRPGSSSERDGIAAEEFEATGNTFF